MFLWSSGALSLENSARGFVRGTGIRVGSTGCIRAAVNISGKPKGHGSPLKTLSRRHNILPVRNPTSVLNMALLSIRLTAALITLELLAWDWRVANS